MAAKAQHSDRATTSRRRVESLASHAVVDDPSKESLGEKSGEEFSSPRREGCVRSVWVL